MIRKPAAPTRETIEEAPVKIERAANGRIRFDAWLALDALQLRREYDWVTGVENNEPYHIP